MNPVTIIATSLAILYWFIDSAIHKFLYAEDTFEIIPTDLNELWMRTVIFLLLISLGIIADLHRKRILKKETEKQQALIKVITNSHEILNNILNQMQYFKMEADEHNDFDNEVKELFNQSMEEVKELVKNLGVPSSKIADELNKQTK